MESTIISGQDVHPGGPDGEPSSKAYRNASKKWDSIFSVQDGNAAADQKGIDRFLEGRDPTGPRWRTWLLFYHHEIHAAQRPTAVLAYLYLPGTLKIIRDNLDKSAIFNGVIKGVGPVIARRSKARSSALPISRAISSSSNRNSSSAIRFIFRVSRRACPTRFKRQMVHSLPGLEHAEILKWSYEIEYDAIRPLQFDASLRVKKYEGLYGAAKSAAPRATKKRPDLAYGWHQRQPLDQRGKSLSSSAAMNPISAS
jgi:tRNA uridine 5-carboxymethylaminomethyl modification enzyme